MTALRWPLRVLACATLAGVSAYCAGVRLNMSASLPLGLYVETSEPSDYVAFCLEGDMAAFAVKREYVTVGRCPSGCGPLLKRIVARPGDTVRLDAAGIAVDGTLIANTAPRAQDSAGRPLPVYAYGVYRVAPGTLWADSSYDARSFGSRYFGPVPVERVRMHLRPLWVTR